MPITYVWLENITELAVDDGYTSEGRVNARGIVEIFKRLQDLEAEVRGLKRKLEEEE
jgi:hypothetical protein